MESPFNRPEHEALMLNELRTMARRHADASGGQFQTLDINPEIYPAQALSITHSDGQPQAPAVIDMLATSAEPRFAEIIDKFKLQEALTQEISRVGELLHGGNNVFAVTNHGKFEDVALIEAGVSNLLKEKRYEFLSSIVISKIVSMLGYVLNTENPPMPATEVLTMLCDKVFLSYPRTESVRKSKLLKFMPNEIERHNKSMRNQVEELLGQGGVLLAIAGSGTTDKPSEADPNTINMGGLSAGTVKMITHHRNTYIWPIAVWLKDEKPFVQSCDIPRPITNKTEADGVMTKISDVLTANVEGKTFKYNPIPDLGKLALGRK